MARENGNLVAAVAAGTHAADLNRTYLFVQCTSGSLTIQIGSGSSVTLTAASHSDTWEPRVVPQNELTITGTGVIVTG